MWPRRLIKPGESVAEYLFRFNGLGFGNANLQTSTLCFPTALGRHVRWGGASDEPHDEPSWLIRAQRTIPDLRVIQLPDMLSVYNIAGPSVSRDNSDRGSTVALTGAPTPTYSGVSTIWERSRRACSATICVQVRSARRCRRDR